METEDQLRIEEHEFLKKNIFQGLKNLNDGFDSESIFYFSESDFEIVLNRVEALGLDIYGIEPWLNGEFYDVLTFEASQLRPNDSSWYRKAFEAFRKRNSNLQYAASYGIPRRLLAE